MLDAPFWIEPSGRAIITDTYQLNSDTDYTLAQHLLTSAWYDEIDPTLIVMPRDITRELVPGHKSVDEIMSICPIPCDIVTYNRWEGKATCVRPYITPEVQQVLDDAAQNRYVKNDTKVNFKTGEPWTKYKERKMWEDQARTMDAYSIPGHPAEKLVKYLHRAKVRNTVRRSIEDNYDSAIDAIKLITDEKKRKATNRLMIKVSKQFLAYKKTEGSDRIYAKGSSLVQLPRNIRQILYSGCSNVDIKAAHLSIIMHLWNIPELDDILAAGVWGYLAGLLNTNVKDIKDELKSMIYIIVYGGGKPLVRSKSPLADQFLELPIMKKIWKQRQKRLSEIRRLGYIVDVWGEVHYLGQVEKDTTDEMVRSLLARQVQSYELYMMLAGFEEAARDDDLLITCWLHDGFYVKVINHTEKAESKLERVASAIRQKAKEVNINVETEIELCVYSGI